MGLLLLPFSFNSDEFFYDKLSIFNTEIYNFEEISVNKIFVVKKMFSSFVFKSNALFKVTLFLVLVQSIMLCLT